MRSRLVNKRIQLNHVYFEIRAYGKYLRVAAIDPITGLETYSTGLKTMGEEAIKRSARHKLEYLINKKYREQKLDLQDGSKDWIA